MRKRTVLILLILFITLGAFLRLYGLSEKGLFFWDEGIFLMGTRFVNWRVVELVDNLSRFGFHLNSLQSDVPNVEGYPVFLQKPGHIVMLSLFSLFMGTSEYLGPFMSAVFGILGLFVVFRLGRYLYGKPAALFAVLLLSLMPSHLYYSRLGMHEINSGFFVLLGVLLHVKSIDSRTKRGLDELLYFLSSACIGFALISSYRWIIFLPIVAGFDFLYHLFQVKKRFRAVWRTVIFVSGLIIPLTIAEVSYFLCFYPDYLNSQPSSYFLVLLKKFSTESQFNAEYPLFYLTQYATMEGFLFLLVAAIGCVLSISRRRWQERYPAIIVLVTLLFFSLTLTRVSRAPSVIFPFLTLVAGLAMHRMFIWAKEHLHTGRLVALLLLLSILGWFGFRAHQIIHLRSGYDAAFNFVRVESNGRHLSTMAPLSAVFFGNKNVPLHPPASLDEMKQLCEQGGYRYLLVDWQKYVWYYPSIKYIEENFEPVITFDNPYIQFPTVLGENYIPQILPTLLDHDPLIDTIKIYDLNTIFHIPVKLETKMVFSNRLDPLAIIQS